jgi:hypothetical protein
VWGIQKVSQAIWTLLQGFRLGLWVFKALRLFSKKPPS